MRCLPALAPGSCQELLLQVLGGVSLGNRGGLPRRLGEACWVPRRALMLQWMPQRAEQTLLSTRCCSPQH